MALWKRPVALINGRIITPSGPASRIRFGSRILSIDEAPRRGDLVHDLEGAFVLAGLINAHDHLELNHYGPLKWRDRYANASEWIDDMRPRLQRDTAIRAHSRYALGDRLLIGGLKNLLAGVTTVAHHNPIYRQMGSAVPVRVVRRFGWAHSFALQSEPVGARCEPGGDLRERYASTPPDAPFVVHVAEGVDRAAADELPRLARLGCLRRNTVLVHGVALSADDWRDVVAAGASLVWCPSSNYFLFGRSVPARQFLDQAPDSWRHLCLGTDSRVTGSRDLLDEIRYAAGADKVTPAELLRMVTTSAARILGLADAGRLEVGVPADLIVIPALGPDAPLALVETKRADLSLVTIGGRPLIGHPSYAPVFGARGRGVSLAVVDDVAKVMHRSLAARVARCPIREPGVQAGAPISSSEPT
jgi:cytosine/adenosine deaminase-related metal-dependent hydrolase